MNWNDHSELKGLHAELSPSKAKTWRKKDKKYHRRIRNAALARQRGTDLHQYAEYAIKHGIMQEDNGRTLSTYINDCINLSMDTEVTLVYDRKYCFGTADAISDRGGKLRIFDLKTGESPVSMEQPLTYAALYCLEYHVDPKNLNDVELRLYYNDEVIIDHPTLPELVEAIDDVKTQVAYKRELELED